MNDALNTFFSILGNGATPTDALLAFLSLYISAVVMVLLIDPVLE
jgi:hypothetical protein